MLRHTNIRTKDPEKKGFIGKFHKTRSVGKPRTRWEDVHTAALEILGNTRMDETSWEEWTRLFGGRAGLKRGCRAPRGCMEC